MKIRYVNYKKEMQSSGIGVSCFTKWFSIKRYWSGKLIHITVKHHEIIIDMRGDFSEEMTGSRPDGSKEHPSVKGRE